MRTALPTRRSRPVRRLAAALLAAGALAACSDSTGPRPPLEGSWVTDGLPGALFPTQAPMTLSLSQDGRTVTGTGTIQYPLGSANVLTVQGSVDGDVVMLTLGSPAFAGQMMTMQAILAEDRDSFTGPLTLAQSSETTTFPRFARF